MLKILFFIILFFNYYSFFAQTDYEGIVSSIKNDDLKNKRIVVLAEESHGGEKNNQLNVELIKFLNQNYDFSVLLIESDFFGLQYKGQLNENIYSSWGKSRAFLEIDSLYQRGDITVKGFDSRHHSRNSQRLLCPTVSEMLSDSTTEESKLFMKINKSIVEYEFQDTLLNINKKFYFDFLERLKSNQPDTAFRSNRILSNLNNYAFQILIEQKKGAVDYVAYREFFMIENLSYYLEKYNDQKVIILGASLHTQPNITRVSKHAEQNCGDFILKNFPNESLFILPVVISGKVKNYKQVDSIKIKKKYISKKSQLNKDILNYSCKLRYKSMFKTYLNDICAYYFFIENETERKFID